MCHVFVRHRCEQRRALYFLRDKQFESAIEVLKSFEKKDQHLKAMAATNLSFIYFLENDYAQVRRRAEHTIHTHWAADPDRGSL
jgi:intraflagellar transport protein 88